MIRKLLEYVLFPPFVFSFEKLEKAVRGKTVVITGASYGIGEQLALLLSTCGTHLVLVARTRAKLEQLGEVLRGNGSQVTLIAGNLYDENDTDRILGELLALPGKIDIVISNAGKSIKRPLMDSLNRYHDISRTNSVNYLAPAKLLLGLTPALMQTRGHVINTSALNVLLLPAPYWSAYQASKTAFDQWFRCNQAEWKIIGVTSSRAYFPLVRTRMIVGNPSYVNAPAMSAAMAAKIIARLCYTRARTYRPWWSVLAETISFFGRPLFEYASAICLKSRVIR